MQIVSSRKFQKNLEKLTEKEQINIIDAVNAIKIAETFGDINHLKVLKGFKNYFRLRVGNLRIGLYWDGDIFEIQDVGQRGDFYNRFP